MALQVGQTVSHYRILDHLGGGGMGVVYTAEDTRLKRTVALKFLPPELTRDPEAKLRFIHEAQAASALQHNNLCVVHDIDETADGQIFICMEYLDGETLKKKIEHGPLNIANAIDIAIQVASGLSKAHDHGIIHRDIKPANILVSSGGVVKIVDFGLAKLAFQTTVTRSGSTVGTAAYMSPEQARGDDVDQRADIWSLGVVLYQMLTGILPFRGEFDQGQIYSILNESPRPLAESRADVPPGLNDVVDKALEKKRSERYGSAQEMIHDLAAFGKAATPEQVPRSRLHHRTRIVAVLAGAMALIVLSLAAYFLLPWRTGDTGHNALAPMHMEKASIAVLPFTDLSPGKDQDYFCSGIAEELTSVLTQIPELKVVSRTRAFGLSKDVTDLMEMGRQLGVVTLLDGSVRKDGNHLRITAQLIDVADGAQIWTDTYDRTLKDIFAIQKEVALSAVAALQISLAPLTTERMILHQSHNIEAYESWMRGSYFVKLYLISNKEQDIQSAVHLYETAIAIDTTYALAYAGLAWAYEHKYLLSGHTTRSDREQVVRSILKAYQLDSLSGAVNAGMGYLATVNRDYDRAYHFHRTALTLEPRSYLVNYLAGEYYASMGLNEQSEVLFEKSIVGDPYYLLALGEAADALEQRGEFQKATSYYERALRLAPNDPLYRASYVEHLIKTSRVKEASSLLDEAMRRDPDFPMFIRCRAMVLAARGERKQALTLAPLPEVYVLLGMWNDALRALEEKAGTSVAYNYQSVATNPLFNPVHNDRRFQAILSRLEATYKERIEKYGDLGVL
jgi:serine/threonine protein kinase/tetratricopeptide (TPR) repeat protein